MLAKIIRSNFWLHQAAKKFRAQLFLQLKSLFFKILSKLDKSFQDSVANISVKEEKIQALSTMGQSGLTRAVVLNNNSAMVNSESLSFLIKGIFKNLSVAQFVVSAIQNKITSGMSITDAEKLINDFLAAEIRKEPIAPLALSAYQDFLNHSSTTKKNELAYVKTNKPRPSAVYWPDPTHPPEHRSIYNELPYVLKIPIIDRATPIGSAGSCFASEIAQKLQRDGYNYVVTEKPVDINNKYRFMSLSDPAPACAAWGTIFNTPSFRQLVEKAFGVRELPKILWSVDQADGSRRYYDPFRENVEFLSPAAFEENYEDHRRATREAFLRAKVFVITLGLNEVWYFKADGSVFSRSPWSIAPSLVEHRVLTVEENVQDLQRMFEILKAHNPDLHLIVTLSPIGLSATFRADTDHIIAANAHSKAVLRVAAEEFVRRNKNEKVSYFPSYEMVNFCTQNPYREDQRNVTPDTVGGVMKLFREIYFLN